VSSIVGGAEEGQGRGVGIGSVLKGSLSWNRVLFKSEISDSLSSWIVIVGTAGEGKEGGSWACRACCSCWIILALKESFGCL
jgi:hypothetical protein